jgi:hypothetical protein
MTSSDSISRAIHAYLDRGNSKYAIMIDGPWGVGKTHFIWHSIIPGRAATSFVYTSLYGLSSFDEIDIEIDAQIEAIQSKRNRSVGTELHSLPRIEKEAVGMSHYSDNTRRVPTSTSDSGSDHSVVVCLDDLERWHGDLHLCLSYINRLVEHKNLKCILIGNLEEMPPSAVYAFSSAREKTIRHIYRYESDYRKIIGISLDLVDYSSKASKSFIRSIIKKNFSSFERLLDQATVRNIRIIAEALQLYEYIYRHNSMHFKLSRGMAFTYFLTLFSALILVTRYLVERKDRDELLQGNHAGNKGFKFLVNMGYFEDQKTGVVTPKIRLLLDTVFYRLDQISLKGLFSIVRNGYYIKADFEGDFDSWVNEQHYDSYLDKDNYYQLADDDARQVFESMLSSLFDSCDITNPVTLMLLAERIIDDIACGVVDYNPVEFKKQFIDSVDSLYASGDMQYKEINIFDVDCNRFANCRDIYSYMQEQNSSYHRAAQKMKLDSFWSLISKTPSNIDSLLEKFDPQAVFSQTIQSEEIIEALESLDNSRLYQVVKWIEAGFDDQSGNDLYYIDPYALKSVNEDIRSRFGTQIGVRANHLRQIAEIIAQFR